MENSNVIKKYLQEVALVIQFKSERIATRKDLMSYASAVFPDAKKVDEHIAKKETFPPAVSIASKDFEFFFSSDKLIVRQKGSFGNVDFLKVALSYANQWMSHIKPENITALSLREFHQISFGVNQFRTGDVAKGIPLNLVTESDSWDHFFKYRDAFILDDKVSFLEVERSFVPNEADNSLRYVLTITRRGRGKGSPRTFLAAFTAMKQSLEDVFVRSLGKASLGSGV